MHQLLRSGAPILNALESQGFSAYLVGGAVRDSLMGIPPHDLDVATSALPREISATFAHFKCLDVGSAHGTIVVVTENGPVEITTFRQEGYYTDHRHPDAVSFTTNLADDLSRRDFTVNAMALGHDGLVDLFGGEEDLSAKIIRCVGDPRLRFQEDALRIFRALRFAACLDFSIEPATDAAIRASCKLMDHISYERLCSEFFRLITGVSASRILLDYPEVFAVLIPELFPTVGFEQLSPYHCFDVYTHSVTAMTHMPPDPVLRLAALLHDIGKPSTLSIDEDGIGHFPKHALVGSEMADDILRRLRFDNSTRTQVVQLVALHGTLRDVTTADIPHLLSRLGEEQFFQLWALDRADSTAKGKDGTLPDDYWQELYDTATEILAPNPCLTLRQLQVNGDDALALGLRGIAVGDALQALLYRVVSGELTNNRDVLLEALTAIAESESQRQHS